MRVGLLLLGPLLLATLSACIGDPDPVADLREIFGADALQEREGANLIIVPVLAGRLVGETAWTARSNLTFEVPKIVLQKEDPGPQGGGGVTQSLELPTSGARVEVQFTNSSRLGKYDARWAIVRDPSAPLVWSTPQDATRSFEVPVESARPLFVAAELLQRGKVAATVQNPYIVTMTAHWVVESSVRPVKPMGAPAPANYDEMADRFQIDLGAPGARLTMQTSFRGTYDPSKGTDVDLELTKPDGRPLACAGTGGNNATPIGAPAPTGDPKQSGETLTAGGLAAGAWTVRVGAMQYGPPDACASDFAVYNNAGPVPYTLDVVLII